MLVEQRENLTAGDITSEVRLVVVLGADPGLGAIASAVPQTQFIAVNIAGAAPAANLSVVSSSAVPDQQGFVAGYLAAVITEDWRVGVISTNDQSGILARQGFIAGARYFCGLCLPAFPPFYGYPLFAEIPLAASPEDARAAADQLLTSGVETFFVFPGAGDAALLEYLAQAGALIIGGARPPDSVQAKWVASVRTDLVSAFQRQLEAVLQGTVGTLENASLALFDVNPALLSPGRQALVDALIARLQTGTIDTIQE